MYPGTIVKAVARTIIVPLPGQKVLGAKADSPDSKELLAFVSELIREKIYHLFGEEIPYQTAVMVNSFKQQPLLIKIQADIIVNRETQKAIIIGEKGKMIKEIGTLARKDIEDFIGSKIYLELFVKVKPKWRESEIKLKEFGY